MTCPLCRTTDPRPLLCGDLTYHDCAECGLVSRDRAQLPTPAQELATYRQHRNDPADPAYQSFLQRLLDPMLPHLRPGMSGLDYGSGPGPAIRPLLEAHHLEVSNYDPFFNPDRSALSGCHDFITCTETAEHFHEPARDFERLNRLLRPGGWLGVMTRLLEPEQDFATWWYRRDPTHVAFYRARTLTWIADRFGWTATFPAPTVALFRKPAAPAAEPPSSPGR